MSRPIAARLVAVVAIFLASCGGQAADQTSSTTVAATESAAAQESTGLPTTGPAVPTSTSSPTTTTVADVVDPVEVATAWIAAYEAGDVVAFQGLMHPEATGLCDGCGYDRAEAPYFSQIGEGTADTTDSRLLALGNGSLNADCRADGVVVTCESLRTTDFGFDDVERQWNTTVELTIEDGLVGRRFLVINGGNAFDPNKVADYGRWLQQTHPDAHAELFAFGTILLATAEQFERHREYVPLFWADQ